MYGSSINSGYWVKVSHKPNNYDKCVQCGHNFSDHFEQYDGLRFGCNNHDYPGAKKSKGYSPMPGESRTQCSCDGFAMRYKESWHWQTQITHPWYGTVTPSNPTYGTNDWGYQDNGFRYNDNTWRMSTTSASDTPLQGFSSVNLNASATGASVSASTKSGEVKYESVGFKDGEIVKYRADRY